MLASAAAIFVIIGRAIAIVAIAITNPVAIAAVRLFIAYSPWSCLCVCLGYSIHHHRPFVKGIIVNLTNEFAIHSHYGDIFTDITCQVKL